jgi:hypothetical protein
MNDQKCPACGFTQVRPQRHCDSPACVWWRCKVKACSAVFDEDGRYYTEKTRRPA